MRFKERDMAQWLERGALSMSLPAMRFRITLGTGFSEISCFSPLNINPQMLHLTQVEMSIRSLDRDGNVYTLYVHCAEMAAGLYALCGVDMAHE